MRRAAGLTATAPVELRATHASWVFLAGQHVWKVKRPVDLGFLDFRALEDRRRYCEEEVRLNRRLAPDVYLGVDPVRATPRGLVLGGSEGPVVEWTVHMRRLPDEDAASSLLAHGHLGPDELERLAERLAAFYAAASEAPEAGSAAFVHELVRRNFAESEHFVGDLVERRTFDEARAFQMGWVETHAGLLRARVVARWMREGHGDLRLEHVYFVTGPDGGRHPIVIDCVEFAARFRRGDVAADVAFLAMELDAARRPDLAAGFLARFAEASGDFGLYATIDFYLSYRAWVRGKVAAVVAVDPEAPADVRAAKRREARDRFALARAYAGRPVVRPLVVAVGGLPGSGKSAVAMALGHALAVPVISTDRTRKALAGIEPGQRAPAELYSDASRTRVYGAVLGRAATIAASGRGVVLDATFSTRSWRADAARLALEAGAGFIFIELTADRELLRARLAYRRQGGESGASDVTDAELDVLARRYQPPSADEGFPILRIDGSGAVDAAVSRIAQNLR